MTKAYAHDYVSSISIFLKQQKGVNNTVTSYDKRGPRTTVTWSVIYFLLDVGLGRFASHLLYSTLLTGAIICRMFDLLGSFSLRHSDAQHSQTRLRRFYHPDLLR